MSNRLAPVILTLLLASLVATACERAEPSVFGSWTAADPAMEWSVDISEDSTWTMQAGDMAGQGTLTTSEEDDGAVLLHTAGRMADVMPEGFQARVEGDTLRLCSAAGCTAMVRRR
jgi:hypothetical protein